MSKGGKSDDDCRNLVGARRGLLMMLASLTYRALKGTEIIERWNRHLKALWAEDNMTEICGAGEKETFDQSPRK